MTNDTFWQIFASAWKSHPDVHALVGQELVSESSIDNTKFNEIIDRALQKDVLLASGKTEDEVEQIRKELSAEVLKSVGVPLEINTAGLLLLSTVDNQIFSAVAEQLFTLPAKEIRSFLKLKYERIHEVMSISRTFQGAVIDSDYYHAGLVVALGKDCFDRVIDGRLRLPGLLMSESFAYMLERKYQEEIDPDCAEVNSFLM